MYSTFDMLPRKAFFLGFLDFEGIIWETQGAHEESLGLTLVDLKLENGEQGNVSGKKTLKHLESG